jgi:V/A-type H+-transporting ATPase subunit I
MLGTTPGYREYDVSPAFMIALPLFAAVLIGDAGYALVFLLTPLLLRRRLRGAIGPDLSAMLTVFGATGLAWGLVTSSFFGVSLGYAPLVPVEATEHSQRLLERITFTVGALHLSLAHLWRAWANRGSLKGLSFVGWATTMWGVYGLVNALVLGDDFWSGPWSVLVAVGLPMACLFSNPDRKRPVRSMIIGTLNSIFPALSMLGDTISYVRLMAIGLAGTVLALSFNELARQVGPVGMVPVLVVGHSLNIALVMIALFAHGVRLNILEFSNNLGMEWSGYPYDPFAALSEESNA